MDSDTPKKVLLTGAAGRIGTAFREYAGSRYRLRLADRDSAALGNGGGHEVACDGIDTVIHLAADPSPRADFYGSLLETISRAPLTSFAPPRSRAAGA
jgi:nucleoside-diphosphate-sugar epimerase